jgi:ArsR family transcriptional regulator
MAAFDISLIREIVGVCQENQFMAITKVLADENRGRTLMALRSGGICVCQIIEFPGLAPSTVSRHMGVLCQAGLVKGRKQGRWVY